MYIQFFDPERRFSTKGYYSVNSGEWCASWHNRRKLPEHVRARTLNDGVYLYSQPNSADKTI